MIAQPQIHARFTRGAGSRSVAGKAIDHRQEDASARSNAQVNAEEWRDVSELSPIEGQVQVFTCVHRNFFTHVMSQALRNAGQGMAVLIVQFFKGGIGQGPDNPTHLTQNLEWVRCRLPHSINRAPSTAEEQDAILELWEFVQDAIEGGRYEQVVLEELSLAIAHGVVPETEVLDLLSRKPRHVDVVLMGQQMPEVLVQAADQVTRLRNLFNVPVEVYPPISAPPPSSQAPSEQRDSALHQSAVGVGASKSRTSRQSKVMTPEIHEISVLPGQLTIPGLG